MTNWRRSYGEIDFLSETGKLIKMPSSKGKTNEINCLKKDDGFISKGEFIATREDSLSRSMDTTIHSLAATGNKLATCGREDYSWVHTLGGERVLSIQNNESRWDLPSTVTTEFGLSSPGIDMFFFRLACI